MVRPPFCEKLNMKRGIWTPEEDAKMIAYVSKHGPGNWSDVPRKTGLKRCGKSCRLRWTNYLRLDLKHDNFTPQEEEMIIRLHAAIGSRWSVIAQQLPGRTDNDVKNYWNTRLRKKLTEMGIDPITHKPFSQILADYGNFLGGLAKPGTRIRSLNRDLKHASFNPATEELYPIATEGVSNINSHFRSTFSSTELESTRECFFNDNFIANNPNNNNNNQSSDLLGQLQAMKLVTEAASWIQDDTVPPIFPEEDSLSPTTSSSSTCSTAAKEKPGLTCTWRDFLCEDEFLPTDDHAQEETNAQFSPKNFLGQAHNLTPQFQDVIPKVEINNEVTVTGNLGNEVMGFGVPGHSFQAPSSSNSSFIDAIMDRENETFLELPCLLEEPFHF